jgi:hypothetical protein
VDYFPRYKGGPNGSGMPYTIAEKSYIIHTLGLHRPLAVSRSLFAVRCLLFAVCCSLFAVRHSLFAVRRSLFAVCCSLFAFRFSVPASRIPYPGSRTSYPGSRISYPGSRFRKKVPRNQHPLLISFSFNYFCIKDFFLILVCECSLESGLGVWHSIIKTSLRDGVD